ncbi:MAG: response regulator [Alphaproteobacteria bacterium]|nr:response regulator [Alphaproteobacteria bacterium]
MTKSNALAGYRVLVVEDELMIALDMCSKLEEVGYVPVGPVGTVDEALALLERQRPDFALLDENLRSVPVTPVAEALRRRHIPFCVISGYDRSRSPTPVLRDAPRLSKPATSAMISGVLEELSHSVAQRPAEGEAYPSAGHGE